MQFGVNGWVWTSPVNTQAFEELAPKVKKMGFDLFEFGIESTSDLDYARAAKVLTDNGLAVSVCAAMGPDRDLIHEDAGIRRSGMEYVAHCIDAAKTLGAKNVVGPLYSAVGRTWQATADERAAYTDLLVEQLTALSAHAADHGVVLGVEPLNRFETSVLNLTADAIAIVDRVSGGDIRWADYSLTPRPRRLHTVHQIKREALRRPNTPVLVKCAGHTAALDGICATSGGHAYMVTDAAHLAGSIGG